MKVVSALHIVLSYLILPYLLMWYVFMIMHTIRGGYYPHYPDHPARYLFGGKTYREIMDNCLNVALFSIPAWLLLSAIRLVFKNYRLSLKHRIVFLASVPILFLHFVLDPGFEWYLD